MSAREVGSHAPAAPAPPRAAVAGALAARATAAQPAMNRTHAAPRRRTLELGHLGFLAALALLIFGLTFPIGRYITPTRGLGYALGITGGSMMLLLFLYSARKRFRWLAFLGPTARWFRFHMVLGVLGPLCILYHADFSLGATNSNVALFSMLTVAGSGLVGRYIYAHIHRGLYGQRVTVTELRERADGLRALSGTVGFLPELVGRLDDIEKRILSAGSRLPMLAPLKPAIIAPIALAARWRVRRYIRRQLRLAARTSPVVAAERKRLTRAACAYADRRISATGRLAGFQAYERLFSLWHALHLPLIFVLIAAGIVHVIAVSIF
ncbi:MAG: pyridine nucleotide-disulfide oxidoreductase [Gammaproteobacteria bacterium]|nr:pyridine nucleotide-disulfide oxidoreductase [Gammaproteobacteria bacterium]